MMPGFFEIVAYVALLLGIPAALTSIIPFVAENASFPQKLSWIQKSPFNKRITWFILLTVLLYAVATPILLITQWSQINCNYFQLSGTLEDNPLQWVTIQNNKSATGNLNNVAYLSNQCSALQISLSSGNAYSRLQAYRNLPAQPTSGTFELSLSFYFPSETPIQALEFSMSKWKDNQRWEWALQWERGEAASQGKLPTWKLWTGRGWQSMNVQQELTPNTWHTLDLQGNVTNGQVHYFGFSCDDISRKIDHMFAPISPSDASKLAVTVSLDENNNGDSYQVYIDNVDLHFK
jgi:hypothetical protein